MNTQLKLSSVVSLLLVTVPALAQKPELVVQTGHSQQIDSVAFSPDGRILASGDMDVIKLWDVSTGMELRALKGSGGPVVFSPDGRILVGGRILASGNETFQLWDISTGKVLHEFRGHSGYISEVAFSPNSETLAISGPETITLWNVLTGNELQTLMGSGGSLAFSPDGKTLVSVDSIIKLWDVSTGKVLRMLKWDSEWAFKKTFSPDGRILASVGGVAGMGSFKLWDVSSGTELRKLEKEYPEDVNSIAFSPDGKTLASGSRGDPIELWDVSTGKVLREFGKDSSYVTSIAFSPDGSVLASGGGDHAVRLWDVSTGKELRTLKAHSEGVTFVAFSPDGKTLTSVETRIDHKTQFVVSIDSQTIKIWDASAGLLRTHKLSDRKGKEDWEVSLSPDGKTLASWNGLDNRIRLWDTSTGKGRRPLRGHLASVDSVAFSPDNRILACGSSNTIKLWNVFTGRELTTITENSAGLVAFSPDGNTLASGGDSAVKLWDVSTGRALRTLHMDSKRLRSVAFSPDGKILAGVDSEKITLCDVSGVAEPRTLSSGFVLSVVFSPDSKILASGRGGDQTIKLWDVSTGMTLRELAGHSGEVNSVAFSPDAKILASGSWDTIIKLWEVSTGKELASLIALDDGDWVIVAPDGLFDGSPAAWSKIIWRSPLNTLDYAPVEAYFNEFYYPGLLAEVLAGRQPKATKEILQRDRRQPQLKLTLSAGQTKLSTRVVNVKIEASQAAAGAQDVRLFRNGSLVKVWRGDVLKGRTSATLEASVTIIGGENRLTAYAFNRDNVKSSDATLTIKGTLQPKKGTLYVLAVGVNKYANPQFDLKYAEPDASSFGEELKSQQQRLNQYSRVEVIPLLDHEATKANILLGIKRLAGADSTRLPAGAPQTLGLIKRAEPEDVVVIYFAGHGLADQPRFYLIPHDIGYDGPRSREAISANLKTIFAHGISDEELERELEGVDAARVVMVIDACNSGQALEAEEKRRGPMNSKGLAQLAYEKGMYILTAAQSYQEALGSGRLGHGYLTYALVDEGLKTPVADSDPKDGRVLLREWLNYATERVPRMQEERVKQERRLLVQGPAGGQPSRSSKGEEAQRPRVFYRRELEAQTLIIARPATLQPRKKRNPAVH